MKEQRAYDTMVRFLDDRYSRLPSDVLGALLSDLSLQPDGKPGDPAVISEWEQALHAVEAEHQGRSRLLQKVG